MLSIKKHINGELIIDKSKFITDIYRIDDLNDIDDYLNNAKRKYKDATHYCYAYIFDNDRKCSDDKEPNGTAGKPILDVLEKNNLNHVLCIVTRYFGGTKLGAGNLLRTYSKSVSSCIDKLNIVQLVLGKEVKLIFDYSNKKVIDNILKYSSIKEIGYDEKVVYIVDIDLDILNKIKTLDNVDVLIIKKIYIEKIL